MAVPSKTEQPSGMNVGPLRFKQLQRPLFVASGARNSQDGVPAAFRLEPRNGSRRPQSSVNYLKVPADSAQDLRLQLGPLTEKSAGGVLTDR